MEWGQPSDGFIPFGSDQDIVGEDGSVIVQPQATGGSIPGLGTPPKDPVRNANAGKLEAMRAKLLESRRLNSRSATPGETPTNAPLHAQQQQADQETSAAVAALIRQANEAHKNDSGNGNIKSSPRGELISPIAPATFAKTATPEQNHIGQSHRGLNKDVQVHIEKNVHVGNGEYGQPSNNSGLKREKDTTAGAEAPDQYLGRPASSDAVLRKENGSESAFFRSYFADLGEWLDMTGYHDIGHRKRRLDMFRERKELEERLASVKKAEEEEDRRTVFVSETLPVVSQSRPSTASMQPPPAPLAPQRPASTVPFAPASSSLGTKRQLSTESVTNNDHRPEKQQRVRQYDPIANPRSHMKTEDSRSHGQSSLKWVRPQSEAPSGRPIAGNGTVHSRLGREENTEDELWGSHGERRHASVELKKRPYYPPPTNAFGNVSRSLRNRYFLLKSWNHDNVTQSQADGLWATQTHNTPILGEAFSHCASSRPPSHVILIFSVNKSAAFQGYAIMTSPPGAAPLPKWAQKLHWTCGEPFYIEWKAKGNVGFRECGYIKNPLNKDGVDLSVVVGRDGQEIEPSAGRELINVIETVCKRF